MCRRCVVCGKYATDNPCEPYHYPRNKKEAVIWQRSMGAFDTCVASIQEQCCVCIKHIPQFVELAQKQAALMTAKSAEPMLNRPSLNVLLLPGATLPPYCGKSGKSKTEDPQEQQDDKLDEDIIVKEFNVDCGTKFPDVDETEVTVLRTPVEHDKEQQKRQSSNANNEQCGDSENLNDCTDVLLLSRSQNHSGEASSQCELCAKLCPSAKSYTSSPEMNYDVDQPLAGCECERKVRREMGEVIKRQQSRILELEFQLCRQSDWHFAMQQKLNELYSEFARLEPPTGDLSRCSYQSLPTEQQPWSESEAKNHQHVNWQSEPSQQNAATKQTSPKEP